MTNPLPTSAEVASWDDAQLLEFVEARPAAYRWVGEVVKGRAPSASLVAGVVDLLQREVLDPQKAALLLARVGHTDGYEPLLELLSREDAADAERQVCLGLALIGGEDAERDLQRLLARADHEETREAAAEGLLLLPHPRRGEHLLAAVRAGLIGSSAAAWFLSVLDPEPEVIEELLEGGGRDFRTGVKLLAAMIQRAEGDEPAAVERRAHLESRRDELVALSEPLFNNDEQALPRVLAERIRTWIHNA